MDEQVQSAAPVEPVVEPAASTEDSEWEQATQDFAQEYGVEVKKDEEPEVKEPEAKDPEAPEEPEVKKDEEPEVPVDNPTIREQRAIQRELAEDHKAISEDIRKEMFSEVPRELTDKEGDPIRTVQDVMNLRNPNTDERFTEAEAREWLAVNQQALDRQLAEVDKQVEMIADVNLSLKDQADSLKAKYGELLSAMPKLRKDVWTAYEATLQKDPKTGLIVGAPVSMEKFYDIALKGYTKLAAQYEAQAASEAKAKAEVTKVQTRADRQDIYSGGKSDTMDSDEKEWASAAKQYYEG